MPSRMRLQKQAIATAQMLKAGANRGASGENAICQTVAKVDFIIGAIAVTWVNAMLGELTPKMAEAIMSSSAIKILLPLSREKVEIIGLAKEPLPHLVEASVEKIKEVMKNVKGRIRGMNLVNHKIFFEEIID